MLAVAQEGAGAPSAQAVSDDLPLHADISWLLLSFSPGSDRFLCKVPGH